MAREFKVFRCTCAELVCRCDERAATTEATGASQAAKAFAMLAGWAPVVVQDEHGNRVTVAFDDKTPFVT